MKLIPLPAFQDNDLWLVHDGHRAFAVDPGDAQPVVAALQRERLTLDAILVTPRHPDHIGEEGEGTPARMAHSLEKLAALPGETRVCCTHQYTLSNLAFASTVEPGNLDLIHDAKRCEELRSRGLPTLPSTIEQEKRVNPFLRTSEAAVAQAARGHDAATAPDGVSVFATLRQWKNEFR